MSTGRSGAGAPRCGVGTGDGNVPRPPAVAGHGSERLKRNFFTGVKQQPMVKAWCHFGAFGVFSADKQVRTVLHLSIAQGPFACVISARGGLQQRSGLVFPCALPSLFCSGISCLGEAGSPRGGHAWGGQVHASAGRARGGQGEFK